MAKHPIYERIVPHRLVSRYSSLRIWSATEIDDAVQASTAEPKRGTLICSNRELVSPLVLNRLSQGGLACRRVLDSKGRSAIFVETHPRDQALAEAFVARPSREQFFTNRGFRPLLAERKTARNPLRFRAV